MRDPQSGQASVELVAVLGAVLTAAAVVVQLALVGYGLWTSANAARAGARAAHVGEDPRAAALSAVPGFLRPGARVHGEAPVRVSLSVPALVPALGRIPVRAAASLDPRGTPGG